MRAALIGAGRIAREHLACLAQLEGVELAAICDRSAVAAEATAERFGAARWFTDHGAMLAETQPDVVHVTTPFGTHFELAAAALEAGAHAIVEKPLAGSLEEVEQLVELARARERHVVEDHNYLFNESVREVRRRVDAGAIGDVRRVEVALCLAFTAPGNPFVDPNLPHPAASLPGGAIADFLPHLASLAVHFAGPHREAAATWSRRAPGPLRSDEMWAEVEGERATASLLVSAHERPEAFLVRVHGTRGRATAGLFRPMVLLERAGGLPKPLLSLRNAAAVRRARLGSVLGAGTAKLGGGPGSYEGLWRLIEATYASVQTGAPPPVTQDDLLATHRLVQALVDQEPAR